MTTHNNMTAAEWLMNGARSAIAPHLVLAELCDRLVRTGVPLCRAAVFVRTLHPDVMGRLFLWRIGTDVTTIEAPFDFFDSEAFRRSPVVLVYATGGAVRRRLADKACPKDFALLDELLADGVTDYFAVPLVFIDGSIHAATWATRQDGGFSDAQMRRSHGLRKSMPFAGRRPTFSRPMLADMPERGSSQDRFAAAIPRT